MQEDEFLSTLLLERDVQLQQTAKQNYQAPLLEIYSYFAEAGYAMSENGEQYGSGGSNPPTLIPPEGYGSDDNPPVSPTGGPDPYTGSNGWWEGL